MPDIFRRFLEDIAEAAIEPTYAAVQALRKRLLQTAVLLGHQAYEQLSAEIDKLAVLAAIRDAQQWAAKYVEASTDNLKAKKLSNYAFWTRNGCWLALKGLDGELALDMKKLLEGGDLKYGAPVVQNIDLLMYRTMELLNHLNESIEVFSTEGALNLAYALAHLTALQAYHSRK